MTTERPRWARSHNTAVLYLQAGEWMLFILEPDRRRADDYTCVTVVNGPKDNDWEHALARGYIHTPPPAELPVIPKLRVGLWDSLRIARAHRRARAATGIAAGAHAVGAPLPASAGRAPLTAAGSHSDGPPVASSKSRPPGDPDHCCQCFLAVFAWSSRWLCSECACLRCILAVLALADGRRPSAGSSERRVLHGARRFRAAG